MKAIQTTNKGGSSKLGLRNDCYIKYSHSINKIGLLSAFAFALLALTSLFPISKGEQNTEAVTGTAQSSSLTLNVTGDTASVELDVNSTDGTFIASTSDNSAAFSVTTNNSSGYTLSIAGSDDDGKLYDETKQYFLEPLTSATSEADFSSNAELNGKWGYKPSKYNSANNDNYLPAPTTEPTTLETTSTADSTANDYSISLGLRASYNTTANTYANKFIITAVPNPIAYVITYDANTTDTVSNMPAAQNSTTSATEITLSDKTPAREDYDFKGWCTVAPAEATPDVCSGLTFQPGDTYGIDQTTENITALYAIWRMQAPYIQDYSYAQCSTEAVNNPVTVIDKRDNETYTVRYINDYCWMTQNLKIDKGQVMTPEDTNISFGYTMSSTDLTAGNGSYTAAEIHEGDAETGNWYNYCAATAGEICQDSSTTEATQDICPKGWKLPTRIEWDNIDTDNNRSWPTPNTAVFTPVAAGYYNGGSLNNSGTLGRWWSSTAIINNVSEDGIMRHSLSYGSASNRLSSSPQSTVRKAGLSIRCVKKINPGVVTIIFNSNGGTGDMEIQKISATQNAYLATNTFTRPGYDFIGWNTEIDGTGTSYIDTATYIAPVSEENKTIVLYAQWGNPNTIQGYTASQCKAEASTRSVAVKDSRDNKIYTVRYINGKCWMTQNLKIDKGQVMTPLDTNIVSNYTMASTDLTVGDNSYTEAKIHEGNTETGNWYNYCATTAGTLCVTYAADNAKEEARYDICPIGWKLPTADEQTTLTDGITGSYIPTYAFSFAPVVTGVYNFNEIVNSGIPYGYGYWWSSTAYDSTLRYYLEYDFYRGLMSKTTWGRWVGSPVRCVKAEPKTTIIFNSNGGSGTMDAQRIDAGTSINLTSSTFTRAGYVFTGWDTKIDGGGESYADGASYSVSASDDDKTLILYAQWRTAINKLIDASSMQTLTTAQCSNSENGAVATLKDTRDNKTYTIAKINDKCWMTQNLRIDKGQAMTTSNTNITSNYTMPSGDLTSGNTYTEARTHAGDASTGNWYNYCAATAGEICDSSNKVEATQDICPKGWKIPNDTEWNNIGGDGSFSIANVATFAPVAAGNYYKGSFSNSGTYGRYWSSTAYSTTSRYYLRYSTSSGLYSGSNYSRYYGLSVRCVLK